MSPAFGERLPDWEVDLAVEPLSGFLRRHSSRTGFDFPESESDSARREWDEEMLRESGVRIRWARVVDV